MIFESLRRRDRHTIAETLRIMALHLESGPLGAHRLRVLGIAKQALRQACGRTVEPDTSPASSDYPTPGLGFGHSLPELPAENPLESPSGPSDTQHRRTPATDSSQNADDINQQPVPELSWGVSDTRPSDTRPSDPITPDIGGGPPVMDGTAGRSPDSPRFNELLGISSNVEWWDEFVDFGNNDANVMDDVVPTLGETSIAP